MQSINDSAEDISYPTCTIEEHALFYFALYAYWYEWLVHPPRPLLVTSTDITLRALIIVLSEKPLS